MPGSRTNVLGRTREERGDRVLYRYDSGLEIETERMLYGEPRRILPIGGPQEAMMNHLVHEPGRVEGRRVLEPFAGSGPLGLMALKLGAAHVDFLDINPRAVAFERANAERNGFAPERWRAIEGSIESFLPDERYDVILANPPFVPTPDGVQGTLTSNGGAEGNTLIDVLFERLDELLSPSGEALVYVMQFVAGERPLLADLLERHQPRRFTELTPVQQTPIPLADYVFAYHASFPDDREAIARWQDELTARHGPALAVQHYVAHLGPVGERAGGWAVVDNLAEKYGEGFLYPTERNQELALARVWENL
jgi:SAM-dependent methyltransferase